VRQAIAVEEAGLGVDFKAKRELELPDEMTRMLKKDRKLAAAFAAAPSHAAALLVVAMPTGTPPPRALRPGHRARPGSVTGRDGWRLA
jgi:hypothetical protein